MERSHRTHNEEFYQVQTEVRLVLKTVAFGSWMETAAGEAVALVCWEYHLHGWSV
jgi:hypothetical protein